MKKFPKASEYSTLVEAKRIKNQKLAIADQLSTISKALTNFADKCDEEGVIKISEGDIGVAIYGENAETIAEAGWGYRKIGTDWLFFIKADISKV